MAESEYPTPDDLHFAGLVQAATAAADESRSSSSLGKRKRAQHEIPIDHTLLAHDAEGQELQLQNSAAVLFREPSVKSKKYSRPPLGKVYASLELAPESFLRLQNAGKDFMLDPDHPERRDVVGHRRHSGGTDVAKLKLWGCVEEFLESGLGDKYFAPGAGQGIPGAPDRTMFWPQDKTRIIKAMMPLMRKMVTNERQRLYAAESRKSNAHVEAPYPPRLADIRIVNSEADLVHPEMGAQEPQILQDLKTESTDKVTVLVNVMNRDPEQTRLIPKFILTQTEASNLGLLRHQIKKRLKDKGPEDVDNADIKVWTADGLARIQNDGEWMVAVLSAESHEWMDGELRVVVEI